MAAGVVQMLHKSLKEAQKDLTSTDDAIKKLTGRDPDTRPVLRRISGPAPVPDSRRTSNGGKMRAWSGSYDKPPEPKRSDFEGGRARVTSRLGLGGRDGPGRESNTRVTLRLGSLRDGPGAKLRDTNPQVTSRGRSGGRDGLGAELRDSFSSSSRMASRLGPGVKDGQSAELRDPFSSNPRLAGRLGPPPSLPTEGSEGEEEGEEEDDRPRKRPLLQSSVIATKVPPRPIAGVEDESSKKRNRRMFGFLMGTLQKFKESEETSRNTDKERRRHDIEVKVQQTQEIEKAAAVQERKDLFEHRKEQKNKIARLAGQMELVAMYDDWNAHNKKLLGYIRTKATPQIFYLPVAHSQRTRKLLAQSNQMAEDNIKKRQEELESIVSQREEHQEDNMAEETSFVGDEQMGEGKEGGVREGKVGSESGEASD